MFMYKSVTQTPTTSPDLERPLRPNSQPGAYSGKGWPVGLVLCTLAFLACILLTVTPLARMPDSVFRLHIAWGAFLAEAGSWLPVNLGTAYQPSTSSIEFFCLITLAFLCYCLGAFLVGRRIEETHQLTIRACIWLGLILAGAIYVVTPGLFSHDMMVYAGYSRLVAVYHANPYFVQFSVFPHDPLVSVDEWSNANSLYGPIWMLVCSILGQFVQPTPTSYVIAFRIFALAAHILNTWLVDRTLCAMGHSQRTRTLGMLLYGWNPLVLLESSLNGHNDVFMLTFVLFGILLLARAEQRGELLRAHGYLPPLVALTLAALVKFAILPIVAAYLLFLACKALWSSADSSLIWKQRVRNWRAVVLPLVSSCCVALLVALTFYGPYWFGHSPHAIISSFANNPASKAAENSLMRAVINWLKFHPAQKSKSLWQFLSQRNIWNDINYLAIGLCLILGARRLWKTPTVRAALTLMLATMCIVLLLTPWFYAWYVTWIVGLAVVCLPARRDRVTWSFFALALTFSYSALSLYLFYQGLLGSHGYLAILFDMVPSLCAFLLCWWLARNPARLLPKV